MALRSSSLASGSLVRLALGTAALSLWFTSAAGSAELLMFRRAGCHWCTAWDRTIGPIYPTTAVAVRTPLRHVHVDRGQSPGAALSAPVRFTPTFVLVDRGREAAASKAILEKILLGPFGAPHVKAARRLQR